jgi:hypothetical protein
MSGSDSAWLGAVMKRELWSGYACLKLISHRETGEYHEHCQRELTHAHRLVQVQAPSAHSRDSVSVVVLVLQVSKAP